MSVPAIPFPSSPTGGVCSTSHHSCGTASSHGSVDLDHLNPRASPSAATPPSTIHKPIAVVGGLSSLFSAPTTPVRPASVSSSFTGVDGGLGLLLHHDRSDELGCSQSYSSPIQAAVKPGGARDHHGSPVSVFQGPRSAGCGSCRSSSPPLLSSSRMLMMINREGVSAPAGGFDLRAGRDRMFTRFLTNAVGSCLDHTSPTPAVTVGNGLYLDDLPFHLQDGFAGVEDERQPYAEAILSAAQSRHSIFHNGFVVRAFYEAEKAHRGQMRATGDPYLQHCVHTAILLATIGANTTVVAAGLLHDTLDDSFMTHSYICRTFGTAVADLVQGVSRLSQLSKLARENNTASRTPEAEGLHTVFLAMADARAVLIKLADRLHNMMTLHALPMPKQQRFAKETLEIFVPLANRLGISTWKDQLENLCFKHLNPDDHRELSSKLLTSLDQAMIHAAKHNLQHLLNKQGIAYHVLSARYKSLYSIHSKMLRKNLTMDEIHDIQGLRLIVETENDCYKALQVVHNSWPRVLGRFKDYISHPKFNGYQSLHTVVSTEDGFPLEVQIRTKEMHLQAEFGFAAHWRYKEGDSKYSSFVLQMVEWARWVVSWQCEAVSKDLAPYSIANDDSIRPPCPFPTHSTDCPFSYIPNRDNDGPIFVILLESDKMSVQEFPANSTVMDLFDRVAHGCSRWTSSGGVPVKQDLRPKLNHIPVTDINLKLNMGDVVELATSIPDKSLTDYREEIRRMYDRP